MRFVDLVNGVLCEGAGYWVSSSDIYDIGVQNHGAFILSHQDIFHLKIPRPSEIHDIIRSENEALDTALKRGWIRINFWSGRWSITTAFWGKREKDSIYNWVVSTNLNMNDRVEIIVEDLRGQKLWKGTIADVKKYNFQ